MKHIFPTLLICSMSAISVQAETWGTGTSATGSYATAWGQNTTASGGYSTAWGTNTHATNWRATAWGYATEASGSISTAWGSNTTASGSYTTAWGANTDASGHYSTAFGYYPEASGSYATAWGVHTLASGYSSSAWGFYAEATGSNSTAFGSFTEAIGHRATSMGHYTIANAVSSVALGEYNVEFPGVNSTTANDDDPIFAIGNGTSESNRSNAFTVLRDGRTTINGDAYVYGGVYELSDVSLKSYIEPLYFAEDIVMDLNPVTYVMTDDPEQKNQIGFIAQEVELVLPEVVSESVEGYKTVDYAKITAVLVSAVQSLSEENDRIEKQNKQLKSAICEINKSAKICRSKP